MDDRRRYFRIEDTVSFTVSTIKPAELQIKINSFWDEKKLKSRTINLTIRTNSI